MGDSDCSLRTVLGARMTTMTATSISMELQCLPGCEEFALPLYEQMSSGKYDACSVMRIPDAIEDWRLEHRTARKRVWRAERAGFEADVLHREFHADDIYAINTSAATRQKRPMSPAYLQRTEFSPLPVYHCGRHAIRVSGVFRRNICVAYLVVLRAGELALVSQILGHDAHLEDGVMYQLFAYALEREIDNGHGTVVYNRHDSGTDGLRFFKERCGFVETPVEWLA